MAERCGTDRVIPLNPASFGKLVRVIFPGIQTRRLGVRGESKYHYVDLTLINDSDNGEDVRRPSNSATSIPTSKRQQSAGPKLDFKYVTPGPHLVSNVLTLCSAIPRLGVENTQFALRDAGAQSPMSNYAPASSKSLLFKDIWSDQYRPANARTSTSYEHELKFPTPDILEAPDALEIELPDITPYLPPRTDPRLGSESGRNVPLACNFFGRCCAIL